MAQSDRYKLFAISGRFRGLGFGVWRLGDCSSLIIDAPKAIRLSLSAMTLYGARQQACAQAVPLADLRSKEAAYRNILKGLGQWVLLLPSKKDSAMKSFAQKVAVVTGAGSGMGRYLAILLARAGADVVICDVNTETLGETETLLKRYNVAVSSIPLDMADKEAVEALPEQVIARHGKVDLLFNNAGVTVGSDFETMPETDWDWVMNINLNGVVNATRAFLPYLKQQPEAVLVNTSSIFGMIAVAKQSVYHTTKFAVRGFTEGLVREFKGSNLSVHCVHPGHIGTNIIKNSRFTETDDAEDQQKSLLGINGSQTEMSDLFRNNGMHPSRAAQIILDGVTRRRSRIFIGLDAKLMDLAQRISPMHYDKLMPLFMIPITLLRNKKPLKDLPTS